MKDILSDKRAIQVCIHSAKPEYDGPKELGAFRDT